MDFRTLSQANLSRQAEWPGSDKADLGFRMLEVFGETGELAEALKKYTRAQRGIAGTTATLENIADEMGDVVIALNLLALQLNIDLGEATANKFNKTSVKYGLRTRLGVENEVMQQAPESIMHIQV